MSGGEPFGPPGNICWNPSISVPAGLTSTGLPVGLQITGNYFDEARLLNIAHRFQQNSDWHKKMPEGV